MTRNQVTREISERGERRNEIPWMSLAGSKCLGTVPHFTGLASLYCSALGSAEMKRLAAFLILLSFYILFPLNLSEGARAPHLTQGQCLQARGWLGGPLG